jgi:phospholipase D1/2
MIVIVLAAKAFLGETRFSSFAPIRRQVDAMWFVDGSSYMTAVADALEAANEEIYIADWWLSPEIYMKRPIVEGERWRLDKILERKAVCNQYAYSIISSIWIRNHLKML